MTETTDIKALREKLWDLNEAHDLRQLGDDIIDQLEAEQRAREAERQRADELESLRKHLNSVIAMEGGKAVRAEKELAALRSNHAIECQNAVRIALQAALRGEQEPVGIFAGTDEYSEARHISWLSGASKLQLGDKLFTHPPKPVVVLPAGYFDAYSAVAEQVISHKEVVSVLEAAGIVVKDGE